jgi:hypothetical protein
VLGSVAENVVMTGSLHADDGFPPVVVQIAAVSLFQRPVNEKCM